MSTRRTVQRRFRRRLALVGAAALVASMTACTSGENAPTESVTLAVSSLHNPFFRQLRAGAEVAADAAGVRLEVVSADDRARRQSRQLDAAIEEGSEAVLVNPVDPEVAASAVRPAVRRDIPVVAVDREVEGAPVDSIVASDNVDGGRQVGHAIAYSIDGPIQVIHIQGDPQVSVSDDRGQGLEEAVEMYDEIDIATAQPAYFDRAEARRVTATLLKAYPNANAVFAESDQMALGAIDALGDRAGDEVKVFGFDGSPAALAAVQNGTMEGTVAQRPEQLGQVAVEQAVTAIDGGSVAPGVPVGVELVTRANVEQYLR
jgi:ribose transport system substrate-binding protein